MPDWLPRRPHIPWNRRRPLGTRFEVHLGMRKLLDSTAFLMRHPANAAWIRASVEELDQWAEAGRRPLVAVRQLVASGEQQAALELLDAMLHPAPVQYEPPRKRTRSVLVRR